MKQKPKPPRSNPFTPSFGTVPRHLLGRDEIIQFVVEAMTAGPTHPGFSSLILGKRGTGKTALLAKLRAELEAAGWVACQIDVLDPRAKSSAADAITSEAQKLTGEMVKPRHRVRGARVGMAGAAVGVDLAVPEQGDGVVEARPTQQALMELHEAAIKKGKRVGVLLLVDEFHNLEAGDASIIASAVQNAKLGKKMIGFIGTGLESVEQTLEGTGFTFFQRCARRQTAALTPSDTRLALRKPLDDDGIQIPDSLLSRAATASGGHPYAIQSVGFHLWEKSHHTSLVTEPALSHALAKMSADMASNIIGPTWSRLSHRKREFLAAMSYDNSVSRIADISTRMGVDRNSANEIRHRLIRDGLILPAAHGTIRFSDDAVRDLSTNNRHILETAPVTEPRDPRVDSETEDNQTTLF